MAKSPDILPRRGRGSFKLATSTTPIVKLAAAPWSHDMTPVDAKTLGAGLSRTPKDLRPSAKKAIARLGARSFPEAPDDVDVEAAYATMIGITALGRAKGPQCEALASFWARRSPTFALDVAVRTCTLAIDTFDDKAAVVTWEPKGHMFRMHYVAMAGNQVPVQVWRGLRLVLAAADDGAYEEAKVHAAKHRRSLEPAFRVLVSFAFPNEQAWAGEDAADALKQPAFPKYATPLLATELEPQIAKRIADALEHEHYIVPYLASAVDIHGAASRGIFASLLKKKPRIVADRRALEDALSRERYFF